MSRVAPAATAASAESILLEMALRDAEWELDLGADNPDTDACNRTADAVLQPWPTLFNTLAGSSAGSGSPSHATEAPGPLVVAVTDENDSLGSDFNLDCSDRGRGAELKWSQESFEACTLGSSASSSMCCGIASPSASGRSSRAVLNNSPQRVAPGLSWWEVAALAEEPQAPPGAEERWSGPFARQGADVPSSWVSATIVGGQARPFAEDSMSLSAGDVQPSFGNSDLLEGAVAEQRRGLASAANAAVATSEASPEVYTERINLPIALVHHRGVEAFRHQVGGSDGSRPAAAITSGSSPSCTQRKRCLAPVQEEPRDLDADAFCSDEFLDSLGFSIAACSTAPPSSVSPQVAAFGNDLSSPASFGPSTPGGWAYEDDGYRRLEERSVEELCAESEADARQLQWLCDQVQRRGYGIATDGMLSQEEFQSMDTLVNRLCCLMSKIGTRTSGVPEATALVASSNAVGR